MTNLEAWFKEMIRLHGLNRIVEDVVSDNEGCVAAAAFKGEDCGMRQHDCQECMKDLQTWLTKEAENKEWRTDKPPVDQMVLVTFLDDQDRRYVRMAALDDTGEYWADICHSEIGRLHGGRCRTHIMDKSRLNRRKMKRSSWKSGPLLAWFARENWQKALCIHWTK